MAFSSRTAKASNRSFELPSHNCQFCNLNFKTSSEFTRHLTEFHCAREGGSYICKYGPNNLCLSLPIEGVNIKDYEDHILRHHMSKSGHQSVNAGVRGNSPEKIDSPPAVSSSKPSVVTDQHKWTIFNSCVNLPAVLNDPRLTKRETDFFTKTWGDSFEKKEIHPSPYLPEITKASFKKYLHRTLSRHRKHIKDATEAANQPSDKPHMSHMSHMSHIHQLENSRAELEQIPKMFMNPSFNLDKLETFNAVFPWSQVEDLCDHTKNARSAKLLQEQLSHYLDVVEVLIAKQIAQKSQAFFHAMTSHDVLQEDLISTSQSVKRLRDNIMKIDNTVVMGSLRILKLSQSRANYVALHNKLKLMSTVHQTQPTIQLLLSTNEFVGALDLISTTQEVLAQELYGIQCFKHLGSQLAEMKNLIEKMIQAEFTRYTASDLNRPLTDRSPTSQEEKLVAILFGMLRLQKFDFIDSYQEEANSAMKALIKQTVIEAVSVLDGVNNGDVTNLADQMRLLNYEQWMKLLKQVFANFSILLSRVQAFCNIATDVAGIAAGRTKPPSPGTSPQRGDDIDNAANEQASHLHVSVNADLDVMVSDVDFVKVKGSIRDMLNAVCDHAHDRCVKVLVARAKDGFLEKLSSSEFVALSKDVETFVGDCERICGRKSPSLRASLRSQACKFVARFHNERKTKLGLILDNERWKQADVPLEFQQLVDHISQNGKLLLPERKIDTGSKSSDTLLVDGHKFAVVGTVLLLLKMIVEYCSCTEDIPSASTNLLTSLIDILKTFNSRTCQLVLGAGALQLVGLKTISTRNLALASRCLQLVVFYIPKVREHFVHLQIKPNYLLHLEQTQKDYTAHIDEINNKLVAIMEGVIENQLTKWEVKPPVPSASFRTICKQITKLHEAIADLFPPSQLVVPTTVFACVNASFKSLLRLQLLRLGVVDDGGPQHGLVTADLAFFAGNYRTLAGLENLAEQLTDVWDKR